jgi:hypothetical protein
MMQTVDSQGAVSGLEVLETHGTNLTEPCSGNGVLSDIEKQKKCRLTAG